MVSRERALKSEVPNLKGILMHTVSSDLIDLLTGVAPGRLLTADERAALLAALHELASAQGVIAKQAMLLASYDEDIQAIEHAARLGVEKASDALASGAGWSYDAAAAADARRALLEAVENNGSLAKVAAAALAFAMQMAGLKS